MDPDAETRVPMCRLSRIGPDPERSDWDSTIRETQLRLVFCADHRKMSPHKWRSRDTELQKLSEGIISSHLGTSQRICG